MPTLKAFHGCFGRLTRDASDTAVWITVVRSKNKKKVGAVRKISNSDRVLNADFSNLKNEAMNQVVAPEMQSSPQLFGKNRHSFKCNNRFPKRNSITAKKPKNSLDLSLQAFSEDLKKIVTTQDSLQSNLSRTDLKMKKIKKELTDTANLLLIQKGLFSRLQQLQAERHPVIFKTKNTQKIQKKYDYYIKSIDDLHDTVGKLKLDSLKVTEGIRKWKNQFQMSTHLLEKLLRFNPSTRWIIVIKMTAFTLPQIC